MTLLFPVFFWERTPDRCAKKIQPLVSVSDHLLNGQGHFAPCPWGLLRRCAGCGARSVCWVLRLISQRRVEKKLGTSRALSVGAVAFSLFQ